MACDLWSLIHTKFCNYDRNSKIRIRRFLQLPKLMPSPIVYSSWGWNSQKNCTHFSASTSAAHLAIVSSWCTPAGQVAWATKFGMRKGIKKHFRAVPAVRRGTLEDLNFRNFGIFKIPELPPLRFLAAEILQFQTIWHYWHRHHLSHLIDEARAAASRHHTASLQSDWSLKRWLKSSSGMYSVTDITLLPAYVLE